VPRLIADADPRVQTLQINVSFPIEEDKGGVPAEAWNGAVIPKGRKLVSERGIHFGHWYITCILDWSWLS